MDLDNAKCIRCSRVVSVESGEFDEGEATIDGSYICRHCTTRAEEQAAVEDAWRLNNALADAGLLGAEVDTETMGEQEYEMREDLTQLFYEADTDAQ